MEQVAAFPVLEVPKEVLTLADIYFTALQIPERARLDSYHLALAAWHGIDFMVSWNCTHIVSGRVRMIIAAINAESGIHR
ncbi:MAG: hypothetical protein Fur0025_12280 [Oscillatoriaceae cyanobacterium]